MRSITVIGSCIWCDEVVDESCPRFEEETSLGTVRGQVCPDCENINYKNTHGEEK